MLFINKLFNSIACLLSFTNLQLVIPGRTWILLYLGRTVYKRLWACLALYFHQFWNILTVIKIKSDIINEDYRSLWYYMSSLIEMLCVLAGKIGFVCWQLLHDLHVTENLFFNLAVNFLYFLSNWVNLLGIFSGIRKLRAFERNPRFWNRYLMSWR